MSAKKLPIQLADNFQVGYFYYLPLSCVMPQKEYKDWYYMNYIDVFGLSRKMTRNNQNYMNFDLRFPDGESYFTRRVSGNTVVMFDEYDLELIDIKNGIIDFIKKNIDMQKYIIIFLNVIKLEDINDNNIFIHDILVYGYDDNLETMYACLMNEKREYKIFEVSYSAIEKGFNDYINHTFLVKDKKKMIISFYLTNSTTSLEVNDAHCFIQPSYDENIFLNKIIKYLDGKVSGGDVVITNSDKVKSIYCGINSYNLFYEYLRELMTGYVNTTAWGIDNFAAYDLMLPFYFTNHKKGIQERLEYAFFKTQKETYQKVAKEYVDVCKNMELIKNKHMKLLMMKKPLNEKIYDEFSVMLTNVKEKEKTILSKLF